MRVYADHAATTQTCLRAREAMLECMEKTYGNPSSLHTLGQKAKNTLEEARESIAAGLGASPREIYFTSGGSESDNQAIFSAARAGAAQGKRHIISTAFEHHGVLHPLERLREQGFQITLLPVHENGLVRPEELQAALRPDTALVSVMYVNNEVGTVQPIQALGALCREAGVPFHTDGVQAVGHIPVDVVRDKVDMLSLSAHKFGGPRGAGVLYARQGTPLFSLIEGGAQERGKRAGTENLPAIVGMQAALEEAMEHLEENICRTAALRDQLIQGLSEIPHSLILGEPTCRCPGIVNLCVEGIEGESLLLLLDQKGICASSGSACTSGSLEPSHVLLAMGLPVEVARGSLRLSLGPDNRQEDIRAILEAVPQVVERLRNMSPLWEALEKGERPHGI